MGFLEAGAGVGGVSLCWVRVKPPASAAKALSKTETLVFPKVPRLESPASLWRLAPELAPLRRECFALAAKASLPLVLLADVLESWGCADRTCSWGALNGEPTRPASKVSHLEGKHGASCHSTAPGKPSLRPCSSHRTGWFIPLSC